MRTNKLFKRRIFNSLENLYWEKAPDEYSRHSLWHALACLLKLTDKLGV